MTEESFAGHPRRFAERSLRAVLDTRRLGK
jgi:hypothetical protein